MKNLLIKIDKLGDAIGDALRWVAPTLARLTVGLVFAQSGWGKLHGLDNVTKYFAELGIPAPGVNALMASTTEFVCGWLLLLGLATRFAAVPLIITMCVALRTALWDQIDSLGSLFGLVEFLYITLLVWLATHGAGPLSLDGLIRLRRDQPGPTTVVGTRPSSAIA